MLSRKMSPFTKFVALLALTTTISAAEERDSWQNGFGNWSTRPDPVGYNESSLKPPPTRQQIISGVNAPRNAFPWMVYFGSNQYAGYDDLKHFCGGSLINSEWVLTAAHCVRTQQYPNFLQNMRLILGKHELHASRKMAGERWLRPSKIVVHPGYERYNAGPTFLPSYDVALVKLSEKLDFSGQDGRFNPISLIGPSTEEPDYSDCHISGWGYVRPDSTRYPPNMVLQTAKVRVIPASKCSALYRNYGGVSADKICTDSNPGQANGCHGDSGGPLQCRLEVGGHKRWVLMGVISGLRTCYPSRWPLVHANPRFVADWIKATIAKY